MNLYDSRSEVMIWLGAIVFIILISIGGMFAARWTMPFQEETRRLTFEQSRAYQGGTNTAVVQYCTDMLTTKDDNQKQALARLIRQELSAYKGPLTRDAAECRAKADEALGIN